MGQIDEEAILKSARILYKSGYPDEAKAVLAKLNTEQAKAMLAKMGGAGKVKGSKNTSLSWAGLIAGYMMIAILAFGLGWMLAPKTQETMLLENINQELQPEDRTTATEARESYDASATAISSTNASALTQISASQTAAVQAATATAEAEGE